MEALKNLGTGLGVILIVTLLFIGIPYSIAASLSGLHLLALIVGVPTLAAVYQLGALLRKK